MIVITDTPIEVRSYTVGKLAHLYGVDRKTLWKMLKPFLDKLGEIKGGKLNYFQVLTVFRELGLPGVKVVEESIVDGCTVFYVGKTKTMYVLSSVA